MEQLTTCTFAAEVENAASGAIQKASRDWNAPLATAYAQVALELRRILHRHFAKCVVCRQEDPAGNRIARPASQMETGGAR